NKAELKRYLPARRPMYHRHELSPYPDIEVIGDSERSDPYHYGLSMVRRILATEGMELASHTFSHYYCLEPGQSIRQFREDLDARVHATLRLGRRPVSLVFPRNQYSEDYTEVASDTGFTAFRGNQNAWMYRPVTTEEEQSGGRRFGQLCDSYCALT